MDKYRAFISYSREDLKLVQKIVSVLNSEAVGVQAVWDQNFAYGYGFHEQIKTFIAHAHVFLPVITDTSSHRGWVHQEIGYALALNIPVLPITVGVLPGEMIQQLHAIQLTEGEEESQLVSHLTPQVFDNLVNRVRDTSFATYECAELPEDRSRMMAEYAMSVIDLGEHGEVRQRGGLSSFHIPEDVITHPDWAVRYLPGSRGHFHCRSLRRERSALGKHAKELGCRIVVNPDIPYKELCRDARVLRLQALVKFLKDDNYPDVKVAFDKDMLDPESLTIVGDWYCAESVSTSGGQGYRQTIFSRHAPSMRIRTELFDEDFRRLLNDLNWTEENSRTKAIEAVEKLIPKVESAPCPLPVCTRHAE